MTQYTRLMDELDILDEQMSNDLCDDEYFYNQFKANELCVK